MQKFPKCCQSSDELAGWWGCEAGVGFGEVAALLPRRERRQPQGAQHGAWRARANAAMRPDVVLMRPYAIGNGVENDGRPADAVDWTDLLNE